MTTRDTGTEQLIKDTAKHVFFKEGRLHATTQDIADAAGVNRTLVNYYFRSKDALIKQVYEEGMDDLDNRLTQVMYSNLPFREKMENFIDLFMAESMEYPYQEAFLITEMNMNSNLHHKADMTEKVEYLSQQIQKEMDEGRLEKMNPIHFAMNMFSMMIYPLIMKPMYKQFYNLSDEEFTKLMLERKEITCKMLFGN
ncbi:TetR/AcrR family transcriptional regulator [Mucilaginibacter conchicola]|uniref:TetR/AcrR family transcriptional regulator n=1 Tax=Mucilaginibacter conchicola TaxID=2303333 RepID=A0A372NPW2_9SPHI|nr:TetR/AcrR family transcriptional regulator [Mucilaginibacter conchicola]RFZ90962.1 TetR/AcrR family transcriptional regulator [Mucilaginibacter conchicola]